MSDQVQEIKDKLNVADVLSDYLRLQKAGVNYKALCPFHNEKTPSFMVSPSRQSWHCFGCSEGGDIFTFIQKIESVEFPEALKTLADKAGIRLEREDPRMRSERMKFYEICEKAAQFFTASLNNPNIRTNPNDTNKNPILNYLYKRGLKDETIEEWRVGYAPDSWDSLLSFLRLKGYGELDIEKMGLILESRPAPGQVRYGARKYHDLFRNRLMFPVFDINGRPVGFSGRIMNDLIPSRTEREDSGKYVNSPETVLYNKSKILYGLDRAKTEIRKQGFAILVEGQFDEILPYQDGVKNVVATSGTALTEDHLEILKRLCDRLVIAFDVDEAGWRATKKGIDMALQAGFDVKVLNVGSGKDPADFVKENPGGFARLVESSRHIMNYYFDRNFAKFDKNTIEGKKFIALAVLSEIKRLQSAIEKSHWLRELSLLLSVSEKDLEDEMRHILLNADESQARHVVKSANVSQKTRKEILAERLLAFSLKSPEHIAVVSKVVSALPKNFLPIASSIYKARDDFSFSKVREGLAADLRPKLDYLAMLSEFELEKTGPDFDIASEVGILAQALEQEHGREVRTSLAESIKKAERENNLKLVEELTGEYQKTF